MSLLEKEEHRLLAPTIKKVLVLMCEENGMKFEDVDWKSGQQLDIRWKSQSCQDSFLLKLSKFIRGCKKAEAAELMRYPFKWRNKKVSDLIANQFEWTFGFKSPLPLSE
jgi:hypothetical protein